MTSRELSSDGAIKAKANYKFQFERLGYVVACRVDHAAGKPLFNLAVGPKQQPDK